MKAKLFILHALSFCWVKEVYVGKTVNLEHYPAEKYVWWLISQSFYGKSTRYANWSENATHYEFYDRMEKWQMKVIQFHFENQRYNVFKPASGGPKPSSLRAGVIYMMHGEVMVMENVTHKQFLSKEFAKSLTVWNLTTLTKVSSMYMTSGNSLYQTTFMNMYL